MSVSKLPDLSFVFEEYLLSKSFVLISLPSESWNKNQAEGQIATSFSKFSLSKTGESPLIRLWISIAVLLQSIFNKSLVISQQISRETIKRDLTKAVNDIDYESGVKNLNYHLYGRHVPLGSKIQGLWEVYQQMNSSQYKRNVTVYKKR